MKSIGILFASCIYLWITSILSWGELASLLILLSLLFAAWRYSDHESLFIKTRICDLLLAAVVAGFLLHKFSQLPRTMFIPWLFKISGLSFLALRLISVFMLERSTGPQEKDWVSFLSYCLFAPTYVAGPFFEYADYRRQISSEENDIASAQFVVGAKRIVLGFFKVGVLSKVTSSFTFYSVDNSVLLQRSLAWDIGIAYVTLIDLYLNFSGYTDISLGVSNLLGLTLPENFNLPILARNLQDFWQRWHMSFSNWLKKYIFMPLNKTLLERGSLSEHPYLVASVAMFLTFSLMGVWHGLGVNYLLYGILQGSGLVCVMAWSRLIKGKAFYTAYMNSLAVRVFAGFLTLSFFAMSLLVFYADTPSKRHMLMKVMMRVLRQDYI